MLILSQQTLHQLSSHCSTIALMDFCRPCISIMTSDSEHLTIASRCPPTPLSIGQAGMPAVSLQGVPLVTSVSHCESKHCSYQIQFVDHLQEHWGQDHSWQLHKGHSYNFACSNKASTQKAWTECPLASTIRIKTCEAHQLYIHYKTTHRCLCSIEFHHKRQCSHGVHTYLCLRIYTNIIGLENNINVSQ